MKVAVIQASSQKEKNPLLFQCTQKAAGRGHTVVNFGVFPEESADYTYVETAALVGLLLSSGAADFVVTGCSSGQGMMLACNSLPGVLCGYVPTPQDAFLFGRINGGNAASLPLGLGFGWWGVEPAIHPGQAVRRPPGRGLPPGGRGPQAPGYPAAEGVEPPYQAGPGRLPGGLPAGAGGETVRPGMCDGVHPGQRGRLGPGPG